MEECLLWIILKKLLSKDPKPCGDKGTMNDLKNSFFGYKICFSCL